jgi:ribonuclease HI
MAGRMLKWSLELSEFDISYESRKALKAQVLADFIAEMTPTATESKNKWTIFVDGSSNSKGSGAGIILENEDETLIEVSLELSFQTTNNQAEYEAFLAGLRLAKDVEAEEVKIYTDSQLVASQISGEYQAKDERMAEYLILIRGKLAEFKIAEVQHVPREHNARADVLSKLASTKRKKGRNQSLIQETLSKPSIEKAQDVMLVCEVNTNSWIFPVMRFLESGETPNDPKEAAKVKRRACSYVLLDNQLYRRGFAIPLLKCVEEEKVEYILTEIH